MEFLKELGVFGAGISLAVALGSLFWKGDEGISVAARQALTDRINSLKMPYTGVRWPSLFIGIFDTVFTRTHLSWTCFLRSFLASFLAILLMGLFWAVFNFNGFVAYVSATTVHDLKFLLVFFLFFNVVPDYLSLLETRTLIRLMSCYRNILLILLILFVDAILTISIFIGILMIFFFDLPSSESENIALSWRALFDRLALGLSFTSKHIWEPPLGVFFYSTFFTSVWLWVFGLSYALLLGIRHLHAPTRFLVWLLPVDTHPLRAIGIVAAMFAAVIFWLVEGIRFFSLNSGTQ